MLRPPSPSPTPFMFFDAGVSFGRGRTRNCLLFAWPTGRGPVYKAILSIGTNPHFDGVETTVESYLVHQFEQDFYGADMALLICGYIRPMLKFNGLGRFGLVASGLFQSSLLTDGGCNWPPRLTPPLPFASFVRCPPPRRRSHHGHPERHQNRMRSLGRRGSVEGVAARPLLQRIASPGSQGQGGASLDRIRSDRIRFGPRVAAEQPDCHASSGVGEDLDGSFGNLNFTQHFFTPEIFTSEIF